MSIKPFDNLPIYLANEAYGSMHSPDGSLQGSNNFPAHTAALAHEIMACKLVALCGLGEHGWAECSLTMAENGLYQHFDVQVPPWGDEDVYAKYVLY